MNLFKLKTNIQKLTPSTYSDLSLSFSPFPHSDSQHTFSSPDPYHGHTHNIPRPYHHYIHPIPHRRHMVRRRTHYVNYWEIVDRCNPDSRGDRSRGWWDWCTLLTSGRGRTYRGRLMDCCSNGLCSHLRVCHMAKKWRCEGTQIHADNQTTTMDSGRVPEFPKTYLIDRLATASSQTVPKTTHRHCHNNVIHSQGSLYPL